MKAERFGLVDDEGGEGLDGLKIKVEKVWIV